MGGCDLGGEGIGPYRPGEVRGGLTGWLEAQLGRGAPLLICFCLFPFLLLFYFYKKNAMQYLSCQKEFCKMWDLAK